jgi:4-hydroxybenzoate polyprenyltransferase
MLSRLPPLLVALRPVQWSKNLFVLAPLVFAGGLTQPDMVLRGLVAFATFCAAASAVYLFNDIRDREADRRHPLKRRRPIASGALAVPTAAAAAAGLALLAGAGALWLGWAFGALIVLYLLLNTAYTLGLKHVVILDVMIVSACFVLRVLAGAAAVEAAVSRFLILCTTFVALFLVIAKRRHELVLLGDEAASRQRDVLGRYTPHLLDQMMNVVTASTVVSYALYAVSPETVEKYNTQHLVYTLPMVLFGIFRFLYLVHRSDDPRNPTESMITDPPFVLNLALWGAAVLVIVYGI